MPPNSYTVLRSDPALIEHTAFVCMFLAASLEKMSANIRGVDALLFDHVRHLRGDGRGLASACACEDQLGRRAGVCVFRGGFCSDVSCCNGLRRL
jgi:hypothetical protein